MTWALGPIQARLPTVVGLLIEVGRTLQVHRRFLVNTHCPDICCLRDTGRADAQLVVEVGRISVVVGRALWRSAVPSHIPAAFKSPDDTAAIDVAIRQRGIAKISSRRLTVVFLRHTQEFFCPEPVSSALKAKNLRGEIDPVIARMR